MEENKNTPGSYINVSQHSFMSAEINEISAALSAFQGSLEQPKLEKEVKVKTKTGLGYSFKYADLSACCRAAAPGLKENGLAVAQIISEGKLITILSHKSGQWMKSELFLPNQTTDYQAYGSAITYLKRYSYCAILGIVADTDDDANYACGNQAEMKDRRPQSTGQLAFTGEQLAQALAEVEAVTTEQDFAALWAKWAKVCPALTQNGTEFYKAASAKINGIRNANAAK